MSYRRSIGAVVDVACTVVSERADAVAVINGTMKTITDSRSGHEFQVQQWYWLPRKLISVRSGKVRMPEWLALDRGLIQRKAA